MPGRFGIFHHFADLDPEALREVKSLEANLVKPDY